MYRQPELLPGRPSPALPAMRDGLERRITYHSRYAIYTTVFTCKTAAVLRTLPTPIMLDSKSVTGMDVIRHSLSLP